MAARLGSPLPFHTRTRCEAGGQYLPRYAGVATARFSACIAKIVRPETRAAYLRKTAIFRVGLGYRTIWRWRLSVRIPHESVIITDRREVGESRRRFAIAEGSPVAPCRAALSNLDWLPRSRFGAGAGIAWCVKLHSKACGNTNLRLKSSKNFPCRKRPVQKMVDENCRDSQIAGVHRICSAAWQPFAVIHGKATKQRGLRSWQRQRKS